MLKFSFTQKSRYIDTTGNLFYSIIFCCNTPTVLYKKSYTCGQFSNIMSIKTSTDYIRETFFFLSEWRMNFTLNLIKK